MTHRIGIIGFGKIAQDQHAPVIAASDAFELAAVASQRGLGPEGVRAVRDYGELLALPDVDAVAICTPPQVRHAIARDALRAGKHVLLEKPPAATLSEVVDLRRIAEEAGRVLFATWHSRHNRGVEEARARLAGETVQRLLVTWKEDVRRWHPGQSWLWEAGGFGVFDPGINALSIVTRILPDPIFVRRANLLVPANKQAPIAVDLDFGAGREGESLRAVFDFRQEGDQTWDIEIGTQSGLSLALRSGGTRLEIDGKVAVDEPAAEYESVYATFDALLREGRSEVDDSPLRLVADAFMIGRRDSVEEFRE
jgi:D-galactose 1-dehydrogenase